MIEITTPITDEVIKQLKVGDMISISGYIFCGRDAVLPKLVKLIKERERNLLVESLKGSVIFHTAVSPAGVGPTSSNKLEIESSMEILSKAGVKLHLGKGSIKSETVKVLDENNSVFAVIPPVTALLGSHTLEQECIAFPELGMEAFYKLKVEHYPAIIGAAHGRSIYDEWKTDNWKS